MVGGGGIRGGRSNRVFRLGAFAAAKVTVAAAVTLCAGLLSGLVPLMAADLGVRPATQWSPYVEWTVENPSWSGNAFDVEASASFRHSASGESRCTGMFHVGGSTWAFRFTGTRTGEWVFETSSDDTDLDGHTGSIEVAPNPRGDAHGFLMNLDGKWGWEGSERAFVPQLVMWDYIAGDGSPAAFHDNPERIREAIREFIDGHGFNGFHVAVIGGRWFDLDAGTDAVEKTMEDPDLRTFAALELLITMTHAAGGMVHLWPWGDHQRSQTPRSLRGGIGGPVDLRLQRYIAARLGPIPGWSMGYGFDLDEWAEAGEVKAWRDSMHRHLGWKHFFGGRPVGPNQGTGHAGDARWNAGLDYSSYEHHRPTYEVYLAATRALPGKPVMSEDRFRIRTGKYPEKDYTEERVRRGLYHSTMAGGAANIWGIDPALSPGGLFPNREQIRTYARFFHQHGRFLSDMDPVTGLSTDADTRVLLSRATLSIVAYRESADSITLDLSGLDGSQAVIAVDTRKPYTEIDLGRLHPQPQTVSLPMLSDWALAVGDFRGKTRGE